MNKNLVAAAIILLVLGTAALAQTPAHKPVHPVPNTSGPTKVTGEGVKTDSGLQYWDIKVGTGEVATEGSHVKGHYTGWLTMGEKFDRLGDANKPYEFTLARG